MAGMYNFSKTKNTLNSVNSLYFSGLLKKGFKGQMVKKPSI